MASRRLFFRGFLGMLAAGFATTTAKVGMSIPKEHDQKHIRGGPMAQAYRLKDGDFHLIDQWDIKKGDTILILGIEGKLLWRAETFLAGSDAFNDKGEPTVKVGEWLKTII